VELVLEKMRQKKKKKKKNPIASGPGVQGGKTWKGVFREAREKKKGPSSKKEGGPEVNR